jgi:polypeptide N-acetylgalactosaminyltransferase
MRVPSSNTRVRCTCKIILVDDNGDLDALDPYSQNNEEMKKAIEELQKLPEIIYVQNAKTEGLIRSRTIGADRVVSSPVIVFLDSHCEVNKNWLEPILERIKEDPTRVIVPIIDIIDDVTYEYKPGANSYKGGFSTSLDYKWIPLAAWQLPNKTEDEIAPRLSPAMPGGLFAMDRLFWEKIGKYDQQMNIWGGENIEMSVRIWQCGGSIEFLPCSRIGHMFRVNFKHFKENFPYLFPGGTGAVVSKNKARCIEVWFDDYKPKFYKPLFGTDTLPEHMQIGDISDRVKLRKDLECKSFDWYYKNVYPELL